MINISSLIEIIKNSIIENKNYYKHEHILIVGENNSGKSKIIKEVIKGLKDEKRLYLIDSPNRNIVTELTDFKTFSDLSIDKIVEKRIEDKYFNKVDVFTDSSGNEIVLNELIVNVEKYSNLFKKILRIDVSIENNLYELGSGEDNDNIKIDIVDSKDGITVYINNNELEIVSDAQHSMIRILMEVDLAYSQGCRVIFIDEFDMNLDHINAGDFIEKLKEEYPGMRFIISAHSPYTVLGANNFDIIKIVKEYEEVDKNLCIYFDSNDLDNTEIIDKKLFRRKYIENKVDIILSNTLKNILLGGEVDMDEFEKLGNLSLRQRVIYNFILERKSQ